MKNSPARVKILLVLSLTLPALLAVGYFVRRDAGRHSSPALRQASLAPTPAPELRPQSQISNLKFEIARRPPDVRRKEAPASATESETPQAAAHRLTPGQRAELRRELGEKAGAGRRPYDKPHEAAEYYRLKRLPEGEREIPVERLLEARLRVRGMRRYSTAREAFVLPQTEGESVNEAALGSWTPLGPGNVGGRTRALLVHPASPSVMYAAGVAGGVWKTTNGGASWTPLADLIANIAVCALAFDPRNPEVIYAGTGEGFFNYGGVRGAGIFKTTDGGASWAHLSSTNTADFHYVNDIVVSPHNPERVYAATRTGVWRSANGGASWTHVLNPKDAGGEPVIGGCTDLAVRTDQPGDFLFAACAMFEQATVYRNTDAAGAGAWAAVHTEAQMGRTALAVAPSNQNVVYAVSASLQSGNYEDGLLAVFRSTSGGEAGTWAAQVRNTDAKKLNTLLLSNPVAASLKDCGFGTNNVFYSQGSYDNVVAVDPADENRVWVGGIDLFRSDDGGVNWGIASHWWAEKDVPQYAHADQHAIVFHPGYNGTTNRRMFVGNDGGLFRTDDAWAAVATDALGVCNPASGGVRWTSLNNGYAVTQFYHGQAAADGRSYFGGTQDNGTLRGTDAGGTNNWREVLGSDGGYVAVDPTNASTVFASQPGGQFFKSTDGGATFSRVMFGLEDGRAFFIAPLVMDTSDPQVLWTGGRHLWRSDSGGAQWRQAIFNGSNNGVHAPITALAAAPSDSNSVLAGTAGGQILRTGTGLAAVAPAVWSDPNPHWQVTRPRQGFVSGLAFDPQDAGVAYATYSTYGGAHVWKTADGGASWVSIDGFGAGALPDVPAHSVVVDPANSSRLYVGTDLGVFVSLDGGASWSVENAGFANVSTESLSIVNAGGVNWLYAFTHGRGAWRVSLGSACGYRLSAASQSFGAGGGSGQVNVTAAGGCSWAASVNASGAGWITINQSGAGVSFTVAANNTFKARVGTISVAGRSFAVRQEANRDTTPPVVTITSPAASGTFSSPTQAITLTGTATDDNQIATVIVTSDRQKDHVGYSTSSNWTANNLTLQPGANTFTVTATDAAGNVGAMRLTVVYKPEYAIGRVGNQYPEHVAADGSGNVYFTALSSRRLLNKFDPAGNLTQVAGGGPNQPPFNGIRASESSLAGETVHGHGKIAVDAAGNIYFADAYYHQIHKITPDGLIHTIAGNINGNGTAGGFGGDDGPAAQARLHTPLGMAVDGAGNVYFADSGNYRVRRVGADGKIATVAGNGSSSVLAPTDVALDGAGNLYIATANRVLRLDTRTGSLNAFAGTGATGFSGDGGPALNAQFFLTRSVAADRAGNVYVGDYLNGRVRKVTPDGVIRSIGFARAKSLAVDDAGNVYIADQESYSWDGIRKLAPLTADNIPPTVTIHNPGDSYVGVVNYINLEATAGDNLQLTHVTWSNDRGGSGVTETFTPRGPNYFKKDGIPIKPGVNRIAVTAWDVAGNSTTAVSVVNYHAAVGVRTLAGARGVSGAGGDGGAGAEARLWKPEAVLTDAAGNVYIADRGNHAVRKVSAAGVITTVAGNGQVGSGGDGGAATAASLNQPGGLALDSSGSLYIADTGNNRIRRVTPAGVISTFAGTGAEGADGDGGAAAQAQFATPVGLAFGPDGSLFVADAGNNRVRRITPAGVVSTVAGRNVGGFSGDGGPALQAQLNFPTAVAFDPAGNLHVSDTGNHRVRRVDAQTGVISTVLSENLRQPGGLAFTPTGGLLVCDQVNNQVRVSGAGGFTPIFAGGGTFFPVENGQPYELQLNKPAGVAVDAEGNVIIADTDNHRVVRAELARGMTSVNGANYRPRTVARGALLTAFGTNLAVTPQAAASLPLPGDLGGTTVRVVPYRWYEYRAPLLYVSPTQLNYLMPDVAGLVTLTVTNARGEATSEAMWVADVAPGVFTASQTGQGVPAANVVRGRGGANTYEQAFQFDAAQNKFVPRPIDLGPEGDVIVLELYGTGWRNLSSRAAVSVKIGGVEAEVLYAGQQFGFAGLDQMNVRVPRALAGRGEVDVVVTVDGQQANVVKIHVR
jgi:uncharacterized protein (TIGR03437 family)